MNTDSDKFVQALLGVGRQSHGDAQDVAQLVIVILLAVGVVLGFALAFWVFRGGLFRAWRR